MKANEFVKKFGWDVAKEIRKGAVLSWYVPQANIQLEPHEVDFSYSDLKRLVESHELVKSCGWLEDAKSHLDGIRFNIATKTWFGRALLNWSMYADKLEQAIADVESCQ